MHIFEERLFTIHKDLSSMRCFINVLGVVLGVFMSAIISECKNTSVVETVNRTKHFSTNSATSSKSIPMNRLNTTTYSNIVNKKPLLNSTVLTAKAIFGPGYTIWRPNVDRLAGIIIYFIGKKHYFTKFCFQVKLPANFPLVSLHLLKVLSRN
jgi:hypothetical protein